jgi:hypothetical protein
MELVAAPEIVHREMPDIVGSGLEFWSRDCRVPGVVAAAPGEIADLVDLDCNAIAAASQRALRIPWITERAS